MAKYYGKIGYSMNVETEPGVWESKIIERAYFGDVLQNSIKWTTSSENANDNLNISNRFSILADSFAINNSHYMKYLEFTGTMWKINNIEQQYPRMILTVGGVYNGPQT